MQTANDSINSYPTEYLNRSHCCSSGVSLTSTQHQCWAIPLFVMLLRERNIVRVCAFAHHHDRLFGTLFGKRGTSASFSNEQSIAEELRSLVWYFLHGQKYLLQNGNTSFDVAFGWKTQTQECFLCRDLIFLNKLIFSLGRVEPAKCRNGCANFIWANSIQRSKQAIVRKTIWLGFRKNCFFCKKIKYLKTESHDPSKFPSYEIGFCPGVFLLTIHAAVWNKRAACMGSAQRCSCSRMSPAGCISFSWGKKMNSLMLNDST